MESNINLELLEESLRLQASYEKERTDNTFKSINNHINAMNQVYLSEPYSNTAFLDLLNFILKNSKK